MIHLDTSFLVDLLRESARGAPGPASRFLDTFADEGLAMSVFVACELYAGAEVASRSAQERARVTRICAAVEVVYPDERFPAAYARLLGGIERRGQRIAAMDLLIATTAVVHGARLVTRNLRDFSRVAGLHARGY